MTAAMATGMSVVQMLMRRFEDPLQKSLSHVEQCIEDSFKAVHGFKFAASLVHDRVTNFDPLTVNLIKKLFIFIQSNKLAIFLYLLQPT
jgi:hypothetical protein